MLDFLIQITLRVFRGQIKNFPLQWSSHVLLCHLYYLVNVAFVRIRKFVVVSTFILNINANTAFTIIVNLENTFILEYMLINCVTIPLWCPWNVQPLSLFHALASLTIAALDTNNNFLLCLLLRLLKGRSIPGKVLLTRRPDPLDDSGFQRSPSYQRSFSQNDAGTSDDMDKSMEVMLRVNIYYVYE